MCVCFTNSLLPTLLSIGTFIKLSDYIGIALILIYYEYHNIEIFSFTILKLFYYCYCIILAYLHDLPKCFVIWTEQY